jgi:hypothetical protein
MKDRMIMLAGFMAAMAGLASQAQAAPPAPAPAPATDLRGVTQNWDKTLSAAPGGACPSSSARFTCVLNNEAVRDNETGLVWAHPGQPAMDYVTWEGGTIQCNQIVAGGRKGFRFPSVHELASLIDLSVPTAFALPQGHPFLNFPSALNGFWTATTMSPPWNDSAYTVNFFERAGQPAGYVSARARNGGAHLWCVRGGGPSVIAP